MRIAVLIVGIIGVLVSLCVVGVSASMPIINGPRASWDEAMLGIVPGAICCSLSFIIGVVGLVLVLMAPAADASSKKKRRDEDDD